MEEQSVRAIISATHRVRTFAAFVLFMLGIFLVVLTIGGLKGLSYIGSGVPASNTISVSGEGEILMVPDIATFSYSVQDKQKDVQTAQANMTKKANEILAYLKTQGVEEKDLQTTDYSVYPEYDYTSSVCPASSDGAYYPCRPGTQTLSGYEASQTVTVKVRDTSKAGALLSAVGSKGATQVSGLNFTVDDEKGAEAQARDTAIQNAKAKAEVLAKSLGVSIVRVVGFSENGNYPMYYAKTMSVGAGAMDSAAAPAPQIAVGQNKITSNVSITYEIR